MFAMNTGLFVLFALFIGISVSSPVPSQEDVVESVDIEVRKWCFDGFIVHSYLQSTKQLQIHQKQVKYSQSMN